MRSNLASEARSRRVDLSIRIYILFFLKVFLLIDYIHIAFIIYGSIINMIFIFYNSVLSIYYNLKASHINPFYYIQKSRSINIIFIFCIDITFSISYYFKTSCVRSFYKNIILTINIIFIFCNVVICYNSYWYYRKSFCINTFKL